MKKNIMQLPTASASKLTDYVEIVDTTDTTDSPQGTSKKLVTQKTVDLINSLNLSGLANIANACNNIGANRGFLVVNYFDQTDGVYQLPNPCPTVIFCIPALSNDITLKMPPMNVSTANAKSLQIGEIVKIVNVGSAGNVFVDDYADAHIIRDENTPDVGDPIISGLFAGESSEITARDVSTPAGTWEEVQRFGTAAMMPASNLNWNSILGAALNPNISWVGKILIGADGNGSFISSGLTVNSFARAPFGTINTGDADYSVDVTTDNMAGLYILSPTVAGRKFILPTMNLTNSPKASQNIYSFLNNGLMPEIIHYQDTTTALVAVYPGQIIQIQPISNANANGGWIVPNKGPIECEAETVGATTAVLYSIPLGASENLTLKGTIVCENADFSKGQAVEFTVQALRAATGDIFINGTPLDSAVSATPPQVSFSVDTGTQTLSVVVNGETGETYAWKSRDIKAINTRYYG